MLSRLVIAFLPRSKCLLLSWLQSPSAVVLEPKELKSVTVSIVSPSICYEVMGPDAMILVFWMLSFKPTFSLSCFTFIKRLFSSSSLTDFPGGSDGKVSSYNEGDLGSIPGSGRSPGKEMATHSITLAWRIPWMEEPGRLQSMGLQRVGHDWATSLHFLWIYPAENLNEAEKSVTMFKFGWFSHTPPGLTWSIFKIQPLTVH